jgi:sterol desaturase/sphingolipid hydroxylase (fatty acid hydroxylase superfamily)
MDMAWPPSAGDTAIFLVGSIAVYYLSTLMIWVGHYLPHRPASRLREFHIGGHHALYPDSQHARSPRFLYGWGRHESLVPQLPWLIGLGLVFWVVLPRAFAWAATAELVLVAVVHSYVHAQFHLTTSWLERFAWFRHAQATHDLHHDRDINFMVFDYFWDRVFGTFEKPTA